MGGIMMDTPWWKILLCVVCPFLIYPFIYFVVDEFETNEDNSYYEDHNMNALQDNVAADKPTENGEAGDPTCNGRRMQSIEMTEKDDEAEPDEQKPTSIQTSRRNLLSDNDDPVVDTVLLAQDANFVERIFRFYEAPFTKFLTNVCSYLTFLVMFCYVMLMDFRKYTVSNEEYILMGWVVVLIAEEVRQMASQQPKHILEKISLYLNDTWNFVDILSLLGFTVAFILRFFPDEIDGDLFEAARIIYIVDIILFIVRSLQMFSVNRQLGPKLVMIKTMLEDLKQFVIILAVFIVSYGVALQAALYPNTKNVWHVLKGIINKPYFQMYGELFYDDFTENEGEIYGSGRWVGPILLGVYMLMTNILLLNLLIAIFNYTFEKIQEGSDRVWKFQRYNLIREYHDRPTLVPPLMILSHIFMFCKWIIQLCGCGKQPEYGSALKLTLTDHQNDQLTSWENHQKELDRIRSEAEREEEMENKVKNMDAKVDTLSSHLERMMEHSFENGGKPEKRSGALKSATHHRKTRDFESAIVTRVGQLEQRLLYTTETLDKILKIVSSSASPASSDALGSRGGRTLHVKARKSPYPGSTMTRVTLPDEVVPWEVSQPDYNPPTYTAEAVTRNPPWADVEMMSTHPRPTVKFNQYDKSCNVDRRSHAGTYRIINGLPENPMGRTGLTGRGLLGRFGPNHAVDPIVTRWKMTNSGALLENGKKVLEFVAIQRRDNQEWGIPGGMVEPGHQISKTLQKEFMEEALAAQDLSPEELEELKTKIDALFKEGIEVFKGYVDDPRNTDVAWVETLAMNFHDDSGEIFNKIKLQAGDDATAVRWQRVSGNIPLYANHVTMLENVAKLHNANF